MRIVMSAVGFVVVLLIGYLILPESLKLRLQEEASVQAFINNGSGISAFKAGDLGLALSHWTTAVAYNPSEEKLHFNLGTGFQMLQRGPEAEGSYAMVLKSPRSSMLERFGAEYNMGVMAQNNKDVEGALKHYQAALDYDPTSVETKINIELLISQGGGGGGDGKEKKEGEDGKDPKDGDKEGKDDKPKEYAPNKPQKPQFKSEQLSPSDVNKILGELKQQEQRIRAEFGKRNQGKEEQGDKDW